MTYINLVLIGFMGSGKSSVAKSLYQKTKKLILDSDKIITNNENLSIPEIFSSKGEDYFRKCEKDFCYFVSKNIQNCIIATGGGMPLFCDVKIMGKVFFLHLDFDNILSRLSKKEIQKRPLFENKNQALELYLKRLETYKSNADIIINANQSLEKISQDILESL
ncbi:shikimate kinase [Helicobacter apodemus]|uniref:Shikimate kinase n=1 Tax=Helicobacter apodemus TaxID=135569 RepID=A0A2U8FDB1_9HELI|nr:shikimate kinase [Helicobacter apodemus]AWI33395.1 shikimate kinase [Helicobacter apodemus]